MRVDLKKLEGPWNDGYALSKHMHFSTYTGENEYGRPTFDNHRTDVGEAVYQLKYKSDWNQAPLLAKAVAEHAVTKFDKVGLIIPMPASTVRPRQPVTAICESLSALIEVPLFNDILTKAPGAALKNMGSKQEKIAALSERMVLSQTITNDGVWNALIVDDLFDSGSSMEAACAALRSYPKIGKIYAVALTWK